MGLSTRRELLFDLTAFGGLGVFVACVVFAAFFDVQLALRLSVGLALSYSVVFAVRLLYFRARPDRSKVVYWYDRVTQSSFPSLHATRVSALAGILGVFFASAQIWLFVLVLVVMTCWTRLALRRHYFSDVLAGVVVGALIAFVVNV